MILDYPYPNPVALDFGAIAIHWYGLMYVLGLLFGWGLGRIQCQWKTNRWTKAMVDDIVFYIALGIIVGGRLGYVLFYNLDYYLENPLLFLEVWKGGMSFHGGLIGVSIAMILFAKKYKFSIFEISDFVAVCVPPGILFGRLGNFINNELWGKVADSPNVWVGMRVYDEAIGQTVIKYPTQLFEAALEGLLLLAILWGLAVKNILPRMGITAIFLMGYAIFRSIIEFWRVPDAHIGYLAGDWLTMGHILSLPMFLLGLAFLLYSYQKRT